MSLSGFLRFAFAENRSIFQLLISAFLILPMSLVAQEEEIPVQVYERPPYKVYKSLAAALQHADSAYILELRGKKLKEIPEGVYRLPHLKVLDLGRNKLKEFPTGLLRLDSLEELDLSSNKISALPADIGKLKNLKKLSLNRNVIEVLPPSIGDMDSLQVIELWDNEIGTLPEEIKNLKHLKVLELRGILFSEEQQKHFRELLPNTRIYMSPSCDCKTY